MSDTRLFSVSGFVSKRDYRGADMEVVRRITSAAALITGFVVVALAPLAPPDEALGDAAGWALLGALFAAYLLAGLGLRRAAGLTPNQALAAHFAGLASIALAIWLSGGRQSPYASLFLFWMVVAGASHTPRRVLGVVALTAVLATLPFFYDDWSGVFATDIALRLVVWSALTTMACVWTTHVRMQRVGLLQDEENAKRQARLDALTGLGNRGAFDERLERAIEHARDHSQPLSVIVSDLDDFKVINDSYGHLNGDEVLRSAATAMRAAVRDADACYRWGGDEFAVLLPGFEQEGAERVAERMSASIVANCVRPGGEPQTLAWGTAELGVGSQASDLLASADLELMTRKHSRQRRRRFRLEAGGAETG